MSYGPYTNSLPVKGGYLPGVLRVGVMEDISAADVSPAAPLTVWSKNTLYPWDWTTGQVTFASTSVSDTLAGTGAQQVIIEGLDSDLVEITETLDLLGATPVVSANSYKRINSVVCVCGTGKTNAGKISGSVGASVVAYVEIGHGRQNATVFTVPSNWRNGAALHRYWLDKSTKLAGAAASRLFIRVPGTNCWQLVGGFISVSSVANYTAEALVHLPPGTDVHGILYDLDTNNDKVIAAFEITQIPWRTSPWP